MRVFSELIQAPICNYYYYNKYLPCNSKGSLEIFFRLIQAISTSAVLLSSVQQPGSPPAVACRDYLKCSTRTIISISKGVERCLNVRFMFL